MPGPQTYAATLDERLYGDKRRYTTHLCRRFVLLPLLPPSNFDFSWRGWKDFSIEWFSKGENFGILLKNIREIFGEIY